jgi:hypothetical protein
MIYIHHGPVAYMKQLIKICLCLSIVLINRTPSVFAQNRASHTLTVRIIHPVGFHMTPVLEPPETDIPVFQTAASSHENQVNISWRRTRQPLQVTASIDGTMPSDECRLLVSRPESCRVEDEIRLTIADTEILQTEALQEGSCVLDYSRLGQLPEDTTIVYTITEK